MTMKNYQRMTKAELLVEVTQLHANSLEGKVESFLKETKLLAEDLVKLARFVYDAGVRTRKAVDAIKIVKAQPIAQAQVLRETSFPY